MSNVQIRGVDKSFGANPVLRDVSLELAAGGFMAVLGPSGCGKTTLLRCMAGFERIDAGEIRIGDRLVAGTGTHLPAHRRQVAIVPQEGALFPHLSVGENVGFGLTSMSGTARRARVEECLELVGLPGFADRRPEELSGGMRQRVAVGRALAPRPPLVLLDEPFSALDAALRVGLRKDVRAALDADGATGILVTHDQGEALSMADTVAVMNAGQIRQCGTPSEIYRQPADEWVARFVGEANVLEVLDRPNPRQVHTVLGTLATERSGAHVVIRPEQVRLTEERAEINGEVDELEYHGHDTTVRVLVGDRLIAARVMAGAGLIPEPGQRVGLEITGPAVGLDPLPEGVLPDAATAADEVGAESLDLPADA
ncbi:ABC transporter ATP-binding protein [Enemella sp. A6]|uniref:ABC transporter ATP-binding protein n=1 Tax=Enemella sp. A6 TaxID=3440152 RepID=UPI003EB7D253